MCQNCWHIAKCSSWCALSEFQKNLHGIFLISCFWSFLIRLLNQIKPCFQVPLLSSLLLRVNHKIRAPEYREGITYPLLSRDSPPPPPQFINYSHIVPLNTHNALKITHKKWVYTTLQDLISSKLSSGFFIWFKKNSMKL